METIGLAFVQVVTESHMQVIICKFLKMLYAKNV